MGVMEGEAKTRERWSKASAMVQRGTRGGIGRLPPIVRTCVFVCIRVRAHARVLVHIRPCAAAVAWHLFYCPLSKDAAGLLRTACREEKDEEERDILWYCFCGCWKEWQ